MANTQTKEVNTNSKHFEAGKALAIELLKIAKSENELSESRKTTILGVVKTHKSHADEVLEGYAKELTDSGLTDATVRNRKTELKTVFTVYTQADTESLKAIERNTGYHDWIKACRDFKRANATESTTKPATSKPLSDNQIGEMVEKIDRANVIQIEQFLNKSISKLNEPNADMDLLVNKQFTIIATICNNMMDNEHVETAYKTIAESILALAIEGIEKASVTQEKVSENETKKAVNE